MIKWAGFSSCGEIIGYGGCFGVLGGVGPIIK